MTSPPLRWFIQGFTAMHKATEAPEPEEHQVSNSPNSPNSRSLNGFELFWTVIVKQICRNAHKFYSFSHLYSQICIESMCSVMSLVFGQAPDPEDSSGQWLSVPRSADWILVVQKIIAIVQDVFPQLNRDRVFNALQTSQVLIQGRKKRKIKRRSFRPCHVMRDHLEPISHLKFCKMSSPLQSMQVFANTMISYHKRFSFQKVFARSHSG